MSVLDTTTIVSKTEGFWNRITLEVIATMKEPLAVNRDVGIGLSAW